MRSDLTAYCEIDPVGQTSENWLDRPEVDTPEAHEIWAEHMLEMPVVAHYVATGDGRALRITDFMSQRQFRDTGVYCEHYRPKDLEYVLATWVPASKFAIGIGVSRDGQDFTDKEKLILELLRPHLVQAWRNAQRVSELEQDSDVGRVIGALHPELIVLAGAVRPVFVGERARQLLHRYFGPSGPGRPVPEPVLRWARSLASGFGPDADDAPAAPTPLVRDGEAGRLVIRAFTHGEDLVLAVEERTAPARERLAMLGLTPREREVMAWVVEGKTNEDIAAILRCAPKTVEKHLEHVYRKLEVSNRAAAAAAVAAGALRQDGVAEVSAP